MSRPDSFPLDDQSRFDRLIDGELSADEYDSLLKSLDEEPDGWRRCALAFLEAQAWSREIGSMQVDPDSPSSKISRPDADHVCPAADPSLPNELSAELPTRKISVAFDSTKLFLAMAASFLIAFALGFFAHGRSDVFSDRTRQVVDVSSDPIASEAVVQIAPTNNILPTESITLVVDDGAGGSAQYIEVSVTDLQETDPRLLFPESSAPPQWIQAFEKLGHRVERQRHIIPVQLEDGRSIVLPVEQFQVVPVVETIIQ